MRISRIKLRNWMCFAGEHVVDLEPGPIAIVGQYKDDPARSNWSGKTAFLESIEWCLFGTHRKRHDDSIVSQGKTEASVELSFDDGFTVIRTKPIKGSVKLECFGGLGPPLRGAEECERAISLRLGMSVSDYHATVGIRQGDVEAFVDRERGERRAMISGWLDLEKWKLAGEKAKRALNAAEVNYKTKCGILASLERPELARITESEAALAIDDSQFSHEVGRAYGTWRALEEQATIASTAETHHKVWLSHTESRARLVARIKDLQTSIKNYRPVYEAHDPDLLVQLRTTKSVLESQLATHNKNAAGDFSGECPVTRKTCPVADEIRSDTEAATRAIHETLPKIGSVNIKIREITERARAVESAREAHQRSIAEYKQLASLLRQSSELEDPGLPPESSDALASRARQAHDALLRLLAIERDEKKNAYAREVARKDAETAQRSYTVAQLVYAALGPSGIPKLLAEQEVGVLTDRANMLLRSVDLEVDVSWSREGKGWEDACLACGTPFLRAQERTCSKCGTDRARKTIDDVELIVKDGSGVDEDVKYKSGGAKTLVGTAVRLAAAMLLRERRGSLCGWSIVDEPFGFLDARNRKQLALMFVGMLSAVGLEQAFVVSHDVALLDAMTSRVIITRSGEWSSVRRA